MSDGAAQAGERWSLRRDERCLRGLLFRYQADPTWCAVCFREALSASYAGRLLFDTEEMGGITVRRMLLPMGFEVRFGLRAGEVEVHHRVLASPDVRAATHRAVERALDVSTGGRCGHA